MPKRTPLQAEDLNYDYYIKERDFCKSKIEILERGLKKGMSIEEACDLAQLNQEDVEKWREKYDHFDMLIRWAKAVFKEKLYDSLTGKMEKNATTAVRFFSEIRKSEKDEYEQEKREQERQRQLEEAERKRQEEIQRRKEAEAAQEEEEDEEKSMLEEWFDTLNELDNEKYAKKEKKE